MRTEQGSTLLSLRNSHGFLTTNADLVPSVVKTGAYKQLTNLIVDVDTHAADQRGNELAAQSATRRQRNLREILMKDHMAPIARIARANLPVSDETEPLKMPKGNISTARLVGFADGMANAAARYTAVFVEAGLPEDFVAQLKAASAAMLNAISDRAQNRGSRGGATKGLKVKLGHGRRLVRVLDAFVKTALKDDPAMLANWAIVQRVQLLPGRQAPSKTPVTAAPPASTELPSVPALPASVAVK